MTATSSSRSSVDGSTTDAQAVRDVVEAYGERLRAADVAGVVNLYVEDATVMGPEMPTAVGCAHLTEVYRGALDAVAMDFAFTFDDVIVRGDTAIVLTRSDGKNTVRATGDEIEARYRELFVLNRRGDDWKIAQYMFQRRPEEEA